MTEDSLYLIWSFEHGAWWGPGRWGYTPHVDQAGRYGKAEADDIVDRANRYSKTVNEVAVPAAEAGAMSKFPSFTCPTCGWVSYNLQDILNRYCGHCHEFKDDQR